MHRPAEAAFGDRASLFVPDTGDVPMSWSVFQSNDPIPFRLEIFGSFSLRENGRPGSLMDDQVTRPVVF